MKYGKYTFLCVFDDNAALPPYKGSTLRGIFGHALKKVVCALKKQDCADCLLAQQCIYPSIFENTIHSDQHNSAKRTVQPPHPYVIEPPDDTKTNFQKGDNLNFVILLFGKANEYLPYFIYAFDQMGQIGIGKRIDGKRAGFFLKQVMVNEALIYDRKDGKIRKQPALYDLVVNPDSILQTDQEMIINLQLSTPLRLKYHNSLKAELPFHILARAMLRRASTLLANHDGLEPALDYQGMVKRAKEVTIKKADISWFDWRRYSNRQDQEMLMGGMIGSIEYQGKLAEYLPLINFCEKVHIGKQTTFGLGKITLEKVKEL